MPSHAIVDFAAAAPDIWFGARRLKRRGVNNLLDRRYAYIGFNGVDIPALGRTLWESATTSFQRAQASHHARWGRRPTISTPSPRVAVDTVRWT